AGIEVGWRIPLTPQKKQLHARLRFPCELRRHRLAVARPTNDESVSFEPVDAVSPKTLEPFVRGGIIVSEQRQSFRLLIAVDVGGESHLATVECHDVIGRELDPLQWRCPRAVRAHAGTTDSRTASALSTERARR